MLSGFRAATRALALLALVGVAIGCGPSAPDDPVARGRRIYMSNCLACHNPDPTKDGSQGPAIAGASRELLEDRVLHLTYPPGYKPKRNTHAMTAFPQLAGKIDDLTAFLQEAAKKQK